MMTQEAEVELTRFRKEMADAQDAESQKEALSRFGGITDSMPGEHDPVSPWLSSLPRNVTVGVLTAAVNTADQIDRASTATINKVAKVAGGAGDTPLAKDVVEPQGNSSVDVGYAKFRQSVLDFRNDLAKDSTTSDEITQGISQYAVPALALTKLIGGIQGATALGTAARVATVDALTPAIASAPHDPRFADILALGKHTEGKFGRALNYLAPDGSLLNKYIDWMTDRTDESDFMGTVKNVVDNLGMSAAGAAVFTGAAQALKGYGAVAKYTVENAGKGPAPGGMVAQRGSLGVANNASGESKASLEAISRAAEEKAAGRVRMAIDANGSVRPLLGPEAVDARAQAGQIIVQRGIGEKDWTVLDRGTGVRDAHVTGVINAARTKLDEAVAGAK
jgi:hypothetical protein